MTVAAQTMPHPSMAELPDILAAPKDEGTLEAIVIRPEPGQRQMFEQPALTFAGGTQGDHWAKGC